MPVLSVHAFQLSSRILIFLEKNLSSYLHDDDEELRETHESLAEAIAQFAEAGGTSI